MEFGKQFEEKVEYEVDSKIRNFATLTIHDEDHTLGNSVRMQLLKDPRIRFSGYRKPHPLENKIEIKVQTSGAVNPAKAVEEACQDVMSHLNQISTSFETAIREYKGERQGLGAGGQGPSGYYY